MDTFYRVFEWIPDIMYKTKKVLLRQVKDTRRCPYCGKSFILDDSTTDDAKELYSEIRRATE